MSPLWSQKGTEPRVIRPYLQPRLNPTLWHHLGATLFSCTFKEGQSHEFQQDDPLLQGAVDRRLIMMFSGILFFFFFKSQKAVPPESAMYNNGGKMVVILAFQTQFGAKSCIIYPILSVIKVQASMWCLLHIRLCVQPSKAIGIQFWIPASAAPTSSC